MEPNPATPAPVAATPGTAPQVVTTPSATVPPTDKPAAPAAPEATVTIPVAEHQRLQRQDARARSFANRVRNPRANRQPTNTNQPPTSPEANDALARAEAAESENLRLKVRENVRDILAKPEYSVIPQSTKDLIMESPHMLSEADTFEDAMVDIEEFLIDQATKLDAGTKVTVPILPVNVDPTKNETPAVVTPTAPAPVDAGLMEDTSNLRGPARSQAVLRNAARKRGQPA